MKLGWPVEIAGMGMCAPAQVVTNNDLAQRIDTTDEWIVQRTGIRERRIAGPGESTLSMATVAARQALEEAQLTPADIDLIMCATITPEHPLPATACELQAALGCRTVPAYDVQAACSGFVWGTMFAAQHVHTGLARNVLFVGAETLTRITDWADRTTCILFGDGAGAAVVRRATRPGPEFIAGLMGADGAKGRLIWIPAGGAAEPASIKTVNERLHTMKMQGREVYKFAVTKMQEVIETITAEAGISIDDISLVVPHQSNLRIIESAADKLGLPLSRVAINIDRYGNTSAASVGMSLCEARRAGRVKPGELVLLVAFGGGLTWGALLMRA
jgi:3-oxoacyl-[acyl-carrier-protein] synthase-3